MSDPPAKPKRNLIMPVPPAFQSIMAPVAAKMHKRLCRVKNMNGHHGSCINIVKESTWVDGAGNDNLEQASLDIGVIGMVVGIAEHGTVLRFMVTDDDKPSQSGIYHVSVLNLEPLS